MLAASGSGERLCRRRRLSSRLTAGCHNVITLATDWTLALFWSTCHSALPAALTEETGHFMHPRNEAVSESNLIISLFQPPPQQTTANSPSSSPWLTPACGKGTNILVDELYGLLTLKDSVDSAWCQNAISYNAFSFLCFSLSDSSFANDIRKAETLLALKREQRRIKSLGILSFSLVSLSNLYTPVLSSCLRSPHSPVATSMVFQEYSGSLLVCVGL